MVAIYANNATGKLGSAVAVGDTSLVLQTGNGAAFPSPTDGDYFPVTVIKSDGTLEIMKCTARSGDVLTVTRSQEATTAKSFSIGDRVSLRITAGSLTDFMGNKQPLDDTLTALAGLTTSADKLIYATGTDAFSLTPLTVFARSFLDDSSQSEFLATVGAIASSMIIGMVSAFARSSAPSGFLKCNGAAISRTSYAALFAVIGTTFGAGDGSTTFNVPDLRGEFVRGWDDARGIDSGRALGSSQSSQNLSHTHSGTTSSNSHTHTFSATTGDGGAHTHAIPTGNGGGIFTSSASNGLSSSSSGSIKTSLSLNHAHTISGTTNSDSHSHTMTTDSNGGAEVRVRNIALLYCIKY